MGNAQPSKETLTLLRERYPAGTRVELVSMDDPYSTLNPGDRGSIDFFDDTGTAFVKWDNGSGIGLVYGADRFKSVDEEPRYENGPSESERNFDAWMAVTESSSRRWTEDEIYNFNGHGSLYYIGGENGMYMRIQKDGTLEAGNYEGAIPHIGEALFKPAVTRKFENYSAAFTKALNAGGKKFLVDMFSSHERRSWIEIKGRDEQSTPEEKPSVLKQIREPREGPEPPHGEKSQGKRKHKGDIER
jgi:hypothetical protein